MNRDNLATVNIRRWVDALVAGDWNALADTLAESFRVEDRRLGLKGILDKAGSIEQARVMRDLGDGAALEVDVDFLETRGQRFALVRQTYTYDFGVTILGLVEVDATGRTLTMIVLDEDDMDGAHTALDALQEWGDDPRVLRCRRAD